MSVHFTIYTISWSLFCLLALVVFISDRASYALSQGQYWRALCKPWKVIIFLIAALSFIIMAPYTGDPTWDAFDAGFMSLFTFVSAPWAVGSLYRIMTGRLPVKQLFVIAAVWMFSVSWCYDIYIFIRDGQYPLTWSANITASSLLYFLAGLLWNLDWKEGKGVILSFREETWPYVSPGKVFGRIAWFALPVMVLVAALMLYFVWTYFHLSRYLPVFR